MPPSVTLCGMAMDDGFRTRGSHMLKVRVLYVYDKETHKHIDALGNFHIRRKGVSLPYLCDFCTFSGVGARYAFWISEGKKYNRRYSANDFTDRRYSKSS